MGRLLGILLALIPFVLAWGGPLLAGAGQAAIAQRIADLPFFRVLAWCALVLGGFIALLNIFLSFGRPLVLRTRGIPISEQSNVSGFPILGSLLLMVTAIPLFPRLWPCAVVTALLLLDTGGPLWFLFCTWHDDALWKKQKSPNNEIQPTDV